MDYQPLPPFPTIGALKFLGIFALFCATLYTIFYVEFVPICLTGPCYSIESRRDIVWLSLPRLIKSGMVIITIQEYIFYDQVRLVVVSILSASFGIIHILVTTILSISAALLYTAAMVESQGNELLEMTALVYQLVRNKEFRADLFRHYSNLARRTKSIGWPVVLSVFVCFSTLATNIVKLLQTFVLLLWKVLKEMTWQWLCFCFLAPLDDISRFYRVEVAPIFVRDTTVSWITNVLEASELAEQDFLMPETPLLPAATITPVRPVPTITPIRPSHLPASPILTHQTQSRASGNNSFGNFDRQNSVLRPGAFTSRKPFTKEYLDKKKELREKMAREKEEKKESILSDRSRTVKEKWAAIDVLNGRRTPLLVVQSPTNDQLADRSIKEHMQKKRPRQPLVRKHAFEDQAFIERSRTLLSTPQIFENPNMYTDYGQGWMLEGQPAPIFLTGAPGPVFSHYQPSQTTTAATPVQFPTTQVEQLPLVSQVYGSNSFHNAAQDDASRVPLSTREEIRSRREKSGRDNPIVISTSLPVSSIQPTTPVAQQSAAFAMPSPPGVTVKSATSRVLVPRTPSPSPPARKILPHQNINKVPSEHSIAAAAITTTGPPPTPRKQPPHRVLKKQKEAKKNSAKKVVLLENYFHFAKEVVTLPTAAPTAPPPALVDVGLSQEAQSSASNNTAVNFTQRRARKKGGRLI